MVPFLLLLLAAFPGAGQPPVRKKAAPPEAAKKEAWPLVSLVVKGNKLYTGPQIVATAGLKLGQTITAAQFEVARERLMKTGAFEEVGYNFGPDADGKGYAGTLAVTEVEQVYPFRFEDLPASDAELRRFLKGREPLFEAKIPGTKEFLDHIAAEVKAFVAAKGFKDGVSASLTTDTPGELTVLFRPSTPVPVVGEVRFTGNQALQSAPLHNAINLVAVGVPYTEKRLRELLETSIRPLYEARGRMRVAFPKVEAKKMETIDGLSVAVAVVEGPEFKLGEVKVAGSTFAAKELLAAAKLKPGDPVNFDEVRNAAERIQTVFRKEGYLHSETKVERQIRDKEQLVDVVFRSTLGRQFLMGKLTIEGLDVTTEPAIRKLWSMSEGKPFNADYPQYYLDRVREDGYFDNLGKTRFDQKTNEGAGTVDVTLYFTGAPPPPPKKRPDAQY